MTPEEKAVIQAARVWCTSYSMEDIEDAREVLMDAVAALDAPAPEWLPATFAGLLAGDRIRMKGFNGYEETTVRGTNVLLWHARNREWTDDAGKTRDHQTPWEHTVLRMDLEANPGMHEYPAGTGCEILCDAERKASLLLQQGFPGSSVVSS